MVRSQRRLLHRRRLDAANIEDTIQKAADVIKGLADGSLDDEDWRLVQEAVAAMIGLLQSSHSFNLGSRYDGTSTGGVAERLNAPVLKTGMGIPIRGSNPLPTASPHRQLRWCKKAHQLEARLDQSAAFFRW